MPETIGFRFARKDARLFDTHAAAVARGEEHGAHGMFVKAADSARTGEPLIVQCSNATEAVELAQVFIRLGATPPALEQVHTA